MAKLIKSDPTALGYASLAATTRSPYPMIIDGQEIRTSREIEVINPATGEVFATASRADEAVLDAAVAAAQ